MTLQELYKLFYPNSTAEVLDLDTGADTDLSACFRTTEGDVFLSKELIHEAIVSSYQN